MYASGATIHETCGSWPASTSSAETVEQRSAFANVAFRSSPLLSKRAAAGRILILVKVQQRVVAVVAYIRIIAPAPKMRRVEARTGVLVHLPGHSCLL